METLQKPPRVRKPRVLEEDLPVERNLSLADVERITGLKIVDIQDRSATIVATLANGVRFHIGKW